jgi:cytochrome c oxidase subunit 1
MILAIACISILGSIVWGHHMYTVGMEADTRAYFSAVTILISIPTGTKVFNWVNTTSLKNNIILSFHVYFLLITYLFVHFIVFI